MVAIKTHNILLPYNIEIIVVQCNLQKRHNRKGKTISKKN
jgi:hypothetical protein